MPNSSGQKRSERLQILLATEELAAIDDWRYDNRIPTRAAAIRELLRRGLISNEIGAPRDNAETSEYGVLDDQLSYIRKSSDAN